MGENSLVVTVPGVTDLSFFATGHDSSYFPVFDLRNFEGNQLPFTDSDGDVVQEGQFFLSPEGTFKAVRVTSGFTQYFSGIVTTVGTILKGTNLQLAVKDPNSAGTYFHSWSGSVVNDSLVGDVGLYIKRK